MKIVFTGGGTAGHVMVNKILIPYLQKKEPDCQIVYAGSHNGMEKNLVAALPGVRFHGISTGKLRRYPSFQNVTDLFRILRGVTEAFALLKKERPQLVYSGGGYVAVPVVWAARLLRIPVLLRETDYTTGLANRLCLPFARKIYVTFPDTMEGLPKQAACFPGMIIRPGLLESTISPVSAAEKSRPTCLIMGGSMGAVSLNLLIRSCLPTLTEYFRIIHICGEGNRDVSIPDSDSYLQLEFTDQIGAYLSEADVVITRCGSNAVTECLTLGKRMVCIPLPSSSSRGEQDDNAAFAVRNGNAVLLLQEHINAVTLTAAIFQVLKLDNPQPYRTTASRMEEVILRHTGEIHTIAFEQLEQDLHRHAQGHRRINLEELSEWELSMYSEEAELAEAR